MKDGRLMRKPYFEFDENKIDFKEGWTIANVNINGLMECAYYVLNHGAMNFNRAMEAMKNGNWVFHENESYKAYRWDSNKEAIVCRSNGEPSAVHISPYDCLDKWYVTDPNMDIFE